MRERKPNCCGEKDGTTQIAHKSPGRKLQQKMKFHWNTRQLMIWTHDIECFSNVCIMFTIKGWVTQRLWRLSKTLDSCPTCPSSRWALLSTRSDTDIIILHHSLHQLSLFLFECFSNVSSRLGLTRTSSFFIIRCINCLDPLLLLLMSLLLGCDAKSAASSLSVSHLFNFLSFLFFLRTVNSSENKNFIWSSRTAP